MGSRTEARQRWSETLERQAQSGVSGAEFCRREGIPLWQFYAWTRRLRRSRPSARGEFVRLSFNDEWKGCGIAVAAGGVRLELSSGFDAGELVRAVKALEGGRC